MKILSVGLPEPEPAMEVTVLSGNQQASQKHWHFWYAV
jgi:hypothetical protein